MKLYWTDDPKAESNLHRMGVPFSKKKIPFSAIDINESQINGARLNDAIISQRVKDYKQGFRNGDEFPRPVVHKRPTGYVILSGNQRCESIRQLIADGELDKKTQIEVYVAATKDKSITDLIAQISNVTHGAGNLVEERTAMTIQSVRSKGRTVKDAAKFFMLSESHIYDNLNSEAIRETLQKVGIEAHNLPTTSLAPLMQLKFDGSLQIKVGLLVAQHQVTGEKVKSVVSAMTAKSSSPERTKILREFEKECKAEAKGRNSDAQPERSMTPTKPRRDKLISLLSKLHDFLEHGNIGDAFSDLDQLQITTQNDRERVTTLFRKL